MATEEFIVMRQFQHREGLVQTVYMISLYIKITVCNETAKLSLNIVKNS